MNPVTLYLFDFSTPLSTARSVMFWIAIAFVIAYFVVSLVVKGNKKLVNRLFLTVGGAYVATAIVLFTVLTAQENSADGGISPLSLYPMLVFAVCVLATAVVLAFSSNKTLRIIFCALTLASLVTVIVCLAFYYNSGEPGERNYVSDKDVNTIALWISTLILVIAVVALTLTDKNAFSFGTQSVTYAGVSVALAFALSYVRIVKMPMGGSITLASLLPIMLYSYKFGVKKGVVIGAIYGVLDAIQDPWILHPAQFLLDYPVAFAGI